MEYTNILTPPSILIRFVYRQFRLCVTALQATPAPGKTYTPIHYNTNPQRKPEKTATPHILLFLFSFLKPL